MKSVPVGSLTFTAMPNMDGSSARLACPEGRTTCTSHVTEAAKPHTNLPTHDGIIQRKYSAFAAESFKRILV
jgi:hypothetical protein